MTQREQLKENIEKEYLAYRDYEIAKPSEKVFDESYRNLFYIELYSFFQSDENGLTRKEIATLLRDNENTLINLWNYAMDEIDGVSFLTWDDIREFVSGYTAYSDAQNTMS